MIHLKATWAILAKLRSPSQPISRLASTIRYASCMLTRSERPSSIFTSLLQMARSSWVPILLDLLTWFGILAMESRHPDSHRSAINRERIFGLESSVASISSRLPT
jgi:hypothetical protein